MARKRLIYLHDGTSVYDLLFINLLKENFDVVFVTFSSEGLSKISKSTNVRCILLKDYEMDDAQKRGPLGEVMGLFRVFYRLLQFRHVAKEKYDLAVAAWATTYGFYAAASGIRPYALLVWGSDVLVQPKKFPHRYFAKKAIENASAIFLDSMVQAKAAVRLGGRVEKITMFPWIDLDWVLSSADTRENKKPQKFVMFNRGHETVYRPLTLIQAIPAVVKENPDVIFLIAGEGSMTNEMKRLVTSLKLERYVRFLGRLPRQELINRVKESSVYVSTSSSDGTSASLIEAMALGVPPVVTDIEANREWIKHGFNGLLFPVDDSVELARMINLLFSDESLARKIGANATQTVKLRVDWKSNSKLFIRKLNAILGRC
jgi:glycosyltransferase involved in cell wall biosynthesis